ncbi:MAG: tyrosine-protein phosphatase [Gammaproteobacteria bacterium]|nr:tyrosine-protein phosphatase [Gammaproteobacteria bacterium]
MPDSEGSEALGPGSRDLDGLVEGAVNLRDLGGLRTRDGARIRPRRLLRSGLMHAITEAGLATLRDTLGIRTVIDFRDPGERAEDGLVDWRRHGVTALHLPPLSEAAFAAQQRAVSGEQAAAWKASQPGGGLDRALYRHLVNGDTGRHAYRVFLERLADPATGPTVFHCSGGRDRTGIAAALALTVLGVDEAVICEDYRLSGDQLRPHTHHFVEQLATFGLTESQWFKLIQCRAATMAGLLDDLRAGFGSPIAYVEEIGVGSDTVAAIRAALLD